ENNSDSNIIPHPYSDITPFKRLMTAIRLILNKPFLRDDHKKSLNLFVDTLSEEQGIGGKRRDQFRKDIEYILKPFQILPDFPMRHGYFAGTGILSQNKLRRLQNLLEAQVKSMENPIDISIYEQFCERMINSKIIAEKPYPIRAIAHQSMIDLDLLHQDVLSRQLDKVEEYIINRRLVELERLEGKGKFSGDREGKFAAWLLQIVFFNDAWYLGFECKGLSNGLLRFERLDRLRISQDLGESCSIKEQYSKLQNLQKLLDASFGIFLGRSAEDQKIFLSQEKQEKEKEQKNQQKKQVIVRVELWFDEEKFKFVCEKTKRFPSGQLKMSPPPKNNSSFLQKKEYEKVFRLKGTKNKHFPYKFQVKLPYWCLEDVSFLSWVIGFGGHVKVKEPEKLKKTVYETGSSIVEVYQDY
ncbi:MAG: WYL domain-containing protein, partial [Trichodesmium sp. MAG_R04]|nr:WYL domain-containing protein [Trichodesmium sp. MAG_R04]